MNTLRAALDAHEWLVGQRDEQGRPVCGCDCGWRSGHDQTVESWADHREQAIRAALAQPAERTLDAAWAECEAACNEAGDPCVLEGISWENAKGSDPARYTARAYRWDNGRPWMRKYASGPTPIAALDALAAALRERGEG
jgi:hypothetical protein